MPYILHLPLKKKQIMQPLIAKGIKSATSFYVAGGLLTLIVHVVHGWEHKVLYPHCFLIVILMALAALPWAFYNLTHFLYPNKRAENLGEFIMHIFFFLLVGTIIYIRQLS
jgi:hypothetical protein